MEYSFAKLPGHRHAQLPAQRCSTATCTAAEKVELRQKTTRGGKIHAPNILTPRRRPSESRSSTITPLPINLSEGKPPCAHLEKIFAAMRREDTRRYDRKQGKMHCHASVHDKSAMPHPVDRRAPSRRRRPAEVLAGPPPQEPGDGDARYANLTAAVGARAALSNRM